MRTQHFLKNTAGHHEWRTSVFACKNARRVLELEFLQSNLKIVNCRSFLPKPAATKTFFSDASQLACAAHSGDGKLIANRMVTELERAESSTFKELTAIKFA